MFTSAASESGSDDDAAKLTLNDLLDVSVVLRSDAVPAIKTFVQMSPPVHQKVEYCTINVSDCALKPKLTYL